MASYVLNPARALGVEIPALIEEQLDIAALELVDTDLDMHERAHQCRKRFKRIRAIIKLAREPLGDAYREANTFYRDAARTLSALRDATAMLETLEALEETFALQLNPQAFVPLREALLARREQLVAEADLPELLVALEGHLDAARAHLDTLSFAEADIDNMLSGLEDTYRRAGECMGLARKSGEVEDFHEWRKWAKYHRLHLRALRGLWPRVLGAYHTRLKLLTDLLGADHDLAVLTDALDAGLIVVDDHRVVQMVLGLAERRSEELRAEALPLGAQLFGESPKAVVDRLRHYWRLCRAAAA